MVRLARIVVAGSIAAVVATLMLGAGSSAQGGARAADVTVTPTTAHGWNFKIETQLNNNFCIQVDSGSSEGRTITLQQCGSLDTQRWTLTWNNDDTNWIVDSQGMCLDGRFRKGHEGLAVPVGRCRFAKVWRFTFTSEGLIEDVANNKCLWVPGDAANAAISLADCDATSNGQLWKLTH